MGRALADEDLKAVRCKCQIIDTRGTSLRLLTEREIQLTSRLAGSG